MGLLRHANSDTKKIELGDEGDYIVVRMEIAKRDFRRFIKYMPGRTLDKDDNLTPSEAMELQSGLFETLVVGWSLEVEPTVDEYLALENEGASAIDKVLADHFASLNPSKQEEKAGFRPS